jgi:hypothetical protein
MRKHLVVADDLESGVGELREEFDRRLGSVRVEPVPKDRFAWDYWYDPPQFSYLRTIAEEFLPRPLFDGFRTSLKTWAFETLGMTTVNGMWLSYYIDGCHQGIHSDPSNGTWAFVYSLTRWQGRGFEGGETFMVNTEMHPEAWQWYDRQRHGQSEDFIKVESLLGRLVVFDSRVPHGVMRVSGTRDPQDSRVVLHGWLGTDGPRVEGPVARPAVREGLEAASERIDEALEDLGDSDGLLVARFTVDADGSTRDVHFPSDTLVRTTAEGSDPREVTRRISDVLGALRFPRADASSRVTVPLQMS